ncbi:hypothetical protein MSS93_16010 [Deinococcus radiodurans]|nr:hypothetical protein MSS93_16010 [Deinococcus radiodurans]
MPILSMLLVMLVVMVETTADLLAIGEITGKKVGPREVAAGLRADGLSTAVGGCSTPFPSPPLPRTSGWCALPASRVALSSRRRASSCC